MQTKVFRHFRYYQCPNEMAPCNVEAKGGITILVDKSRIKENKLIVSYAVCSRDDVFCKAKGRSLAEQRMGGYTDAQLEQRTISYVRNSYKESFEKAFPHLFNVAKPKFVKKPVFDTAELF